MSSTTPLWWTTPLQCFAVAASATMFGGSGLLSPIISPLLENPEIPAKFQALQTNQFLHTAERIFPPTNALSTVSNLILTVTAYLKRDAIYGHAAVLGARLSPLGVALGFNVATTVYTLVFMVPKNNRLRDLAAKMEKEPQDKKVEGEFREAQKVWTAWAWGRAGLMLGAAVAGLYALTVDASHVKL